jgi:HSP20 family molecular chaperone IbpA
MQPLKIPYDMYQSPKELVVSLPLGGVKKDSVKVLIESYRLVIRFDRVKPTYRPDLVIVQEECYRGPCEVLVDLPNNIMFSDIHSRLSAENTLEVIIPRMLIPDEIAVELE